MSTFLDAVVARLDTPNRHKFIKYSLVSVVSVVITLAIQTFCILVLHMTGGWSAVIASSIAAIPSYLLNRGWVWKKGGRSHMMKEVVPFWVMVFLGLGFSTMSATFTDRVVDEYTNSHLIRAVMIDTATILTFGVLWVVKFVIFNKILFVHREEDLDPTLDGRSGMPT